MRSFSGTSLTFAAAVVVCLVSVTACRKVGELKAMKTFKAANQAYQAQDYKKAAQLYEETIQDAPDSEQAHQAYFFLGNSYDQLYKPSKKGEKANDELLTKAADNYALGAEKLMADEKPDDKKLGKLSMEYLVAAYGPEKLNDPGKAEPIVQKMIQTDPSDTANYFQLAKIYEDAGAYDAAENVYMRAKEAKPNDPAVYQMVAGYYNRQGQFDKTIDALTTGASKEPNNPEAFHRIAGYYWDEAYRDFRLNDKQKRDFVERGIQAEDRAIQLKPDYPEAMVFKGLLLRLQANCCEKDPKKQQELLKEATLLHDKAEEIRKKKVSGTN